MNHLPTNDLIRWLEDHPVELANIKYAIGIIESRSLAKKHLPHKGCKPVPGVDVKEVPFEEFQRFSDTLPLAL